MTRHQVCTLSPGKAARFTLLPLSTLLLASPAQASLFSGDTLDFVANILAWVVLFIAPVIAITVFWLVHILPERIAEQRHHPQASAIKTLCLLSLVFGGLLWPLAWLWAYSKPVLHKLAYGTDTVHPHGEPTAPTIVVPVVSTSRKSVPRGEPPRTGPRVHEPPRQVG